MEPYVIFTDATADLSAEFCREKDIRVVPMSYDIEGREYRFSPFASDITSDEFFELMDKGKIARTAGINEAEYQKLFEEVLLAGKDLLYIGFSSALSSSYSVSELCVRRLKEKYPERKIYAVDSLSASAGEGLLVYTAACLREEGKTIDQLAQWLYDERLHLCHWFTVDDLGALQRGGRVSSAAAKVGTILNIKPVLHVDDDGRLMKVEMVRGRRKSLEAMAEAMAKTVTKELSRQVFICYGSCRSDAGLLSDMVQKLCGPMEITLLHMGPVIGAHTGSSVLALFFFGEKR
ncbi:MAG: DegV family protein [Peptococcaceae bacterium]|nr:DegV family protein [Peptococcaceae bacterium]